MIIMAKNRIKPVEAEEVGEPRTLTFRPEDERIIPAIKEQARLDRRSQNQMVQILLEEALKARGAWPPK